MSFTDEDLKRRCDGAYKECKGCSCHNDRPALLTRLEAETNCADLLQLHFDSGVFDDLDEGDVALIIQALEAWRRAAGKE